MNLKLESLSTLDVSIDITSYQSLAIDSDILLISFLESSSPSSTLLNLHLYILGDNRQRKQENSKEILSLSFE